MFNTSNRQPAPLETLGGLVTIANPPDLPEGASPRCYDVDFVVGSVESRPGEQNIYSFSGLFSQQLAGLGQNVESPNQPDEPWTTPNNITVNDGTDYAYVQLNYTAPTGPSVVQSNIAIYSPNTSHNPVTVSTLLNVTAGNLIVVFYYGYTFGEDGTITDSQSNTYNTHHQTSDFDELYCSFTTAGSTGPLTVSVPLVLAAYNQIVTVAEVSNWSTTQGNPVFSIGGVTVDFTQSGTTLNNNELVLSFAASFDFGTAVTFSEAGGWGILNQVSNESTGIVAGALVSQVIPTAGAFTAAVTSSVLPSSATQYRMAYIRINVDPTPDISTYLQASDFPLAIPLTCTIMGMQVLVTGYQTSTDPAAFLNLGLIAPTVSSPTFSFQLPLTDPGIVTLATPTSNWGLVLTPALLNDPAFGFYFQAQALDFATADFYISAVMIKVWLSPTIPSDFLYVKTFEKEDGTITTLALDALGTLWGENVNTDPRVLNGIYTGVLPGSYAKSVTAFEREYICLSNLQQGTDVPRQWDGTNLDRISQCGPGAAPKISISNTTYGIVSITQAPAISIAYGVLCSSGAGESQVGSVYTYYFPLEQTGMPQVGQVVYVTGAPDEEGIDFNGTFVVTGVNPSVQGAHGTYSTFSVVGSGLGYYTTPPSPTGTFQITQAQITTLTPVPNMDVGYQFTVSDESPSSWNGVWTCDSLVNGGQYFITNTVLTNGTATYTFVTAEIMEANPIVGELITVFGSTNGDGIFNVSSASITAVDDIALTFSISINSPNISEASDSGNAFINPTVFTFDPGASLVGSMTNPIFGNGTTGSISVAGGLAAGTRQAVVMFLTRNGFLTQPSPPVVFSTAVNTSVITAVDLPIGPSNVIARWIAITEAGQEGVPGGNYFSLPQNVTVNVDGTTTVYTATVVMNNTSTSASFRLSDVVLLNSLAIDIYGQNQFNLQELGSCAWDMAYAGRNFYGLVQNKVGNLLNMSFDGGYVTSHVPGNVVGSPPVDEGGSGTIPAGWSVNALYPYNGTLSASPTFGNAYYVLNSSGVTQDVIGMITQNASYDYLGTPIINPQITYSARVTVRCPSGINTSGNLIVDLHSNQFLPLDEQFGSLSIPLSSMTSNMQIFTGTLLTTAFTTAVPSDLQIRVWGQNILSDSDFEIDRIEVFPTLTSVLNADVSVSYVDNPESVDVITGSMGLDGENLQSVLGGFVMYDTAYFLKSGSMYSSTDSPSVEPAQWGVHEVSNRVGTCGISSYDVGEEWVVTACRNGIYVFSGSEPMKISQEIFQVWEAVNWEYGNTIWVKNDLINKRIMVGVPMATPNFWLPLAPVNPNPTSPNVILICSYLGLDSVAMLETSPQDHVTIIGALMALDMRRKWTLWQIECPYADFITRPDGLSQPIFLCNGINSSKIYQLIAPEIMGTQYSDDGQVINSLYTTYGFVNPAKAKEYPLLGAQRKLYNYLQVLASGAGKLIVGLYHNTLSDKYKYIVPNGGLPLMSTEYDFERPLNVSGNRAYVEFSSNTFGTYWNLSKMWLFGIRHPNLPIKGSASK